MYPKEMIFKMPQFEVKYINENNWKKVPEKDFLLNLLDAFALITPILRKMFEGEEIVTSEFRFTSPPLLSIGFVFLRTGCFRNVSAEVNSEQTACPLFGVAPLTSTMSDNFSWLVKTKAGMSNKTAIRK